MSEPALTGALWRSISPTYRAILPGPGEPLEEALSHAGIEISEVRAVGLSHLHVDHAGGLRHFTGVPVHCQRRELEFGLTAEAERHAIYRVDFDDPAHDWHLADGDVEIAPGVTAILTAGHTPGHQSFVVDLDESVGGGGFVFAFDAADHGEHRAGGLDRRTGRRDSGGVHRAGPAVEGHGGGAWLPADPRPRPGRLACPHR